jgi:hypothetical protein
VNCGWRLGADLKLESRLARIGRRRPTLDIGTAHRSSGTNPRPDHFFPMVGYTGPNNRRYEYRNRLIALAALSASMVGAVLGWLRLRKKS